MAYNAGLWKKLSNNNKKNVTLLIIIHSKAKKDLLKPFDLIIHLKIQI